MEPNWEVEFLKAMRGLTLLYNKAWSEDLAEIYRTILRPLTVPQLIRAIELWVNDPKNVFFPLPAQLKALVMPQDTEGEAGLIAARIWKACSYGTDTLNETRAKNFIDSDVGWAVVQNSGGWSSFQGSVQNLSQGPILQAQWRGAILEMMQKKKRGEDLTPRLTLHNKDLKSLGVTMKSIGEVPNDFRKQFSEDAEENEQRD